MEDDLVIDACVRHVRAEAPEYQQRAFLRSLLNARTLLVAAVVPMLVMLATLPSCAARAPENRPRLPPAGDGPPRAPVRASALATQPQPLDVAIPASEYPPEALAADAEGLVVLKILIDATGRVRQAKTSKDPGFGFADAAMRSAIAHFRFSPARLDGRPVACWWTFTVAYVLPRR